MGVFSRDRLIIDGACFSRHGTLRNPGKSSGASHDSGLFRDMQPRGHWDHAGVIIGIPFTRWGV